MLRFDLLFYYKLWNVFCWRVSKTSTDITVTAIIFMKMWPFKCDDLHNLVPFIQFKKCCFCKVTPLHGCFSRFLNCTNGSKSRKASQMYQRRNGTRNAWKGWIWIGIRLNQVNLFQICFNKIINKSCLTKTQLFKY